MRVAPRVTVLICTYNSASTLPAALKSLDGQSLARTQFEVLVVDDGSTDGTEEIVRAFDARYIRHPVNRGLSAACNRGLAEAAGDYLVRLDADDTFEPGILAAMVPWLEDGETDFVSCDRYERDGRTGTRRQITIEEFDVFKLIAIGVMMRRNLLVEIGGYRKLFWEEYDLFIRYLLRSGKPPRHLHEPLLTYTLHAHSMTANPERTRDGWKEFLSQWSPQQAEQFGHLPAAALEGVRP